MAKIRRINNKGFTLAEALIVMVIAAVTAAMSFYVYKGAVNSSEISQYKKNLTVLQVSAETYGQMNNYIYTDLSPSSLLSLQLLPDSWGANSSLGADWASPSNQAGMVTGYYIGPPLNGSSGNFAIGIYAPSMTNNEAYGICTGIENDISSVVYGSINTQVSYGGVNCKAIPQNNSMLAGGKIYFGMN